MKKVIEDVLNFIEQLQTDFFFFIAKYILITVVKCPVVSVIYLVVIIHVVIYYKVLEEEEKIVIDKLLDKYIIKTFPLVFIILMFLQCCFVYTTLYVCYVLSQV